MLILGMEKILKEIQKGSTIKGINYRPMEIEVKSEAKSGVWLDICLREGKNREIRRIFSHLGCYVINLKRTSYGQINLGQLKIKCHEFIDSKRISEFIDTH